MSDKLTATVKGEILRGVCEWVREHPGAGGVWVRRCEGKLLASAGVRDAADQAEHALAEGGVVLGWSPASAVDASVLPCVASLVGLSLRQEGLLAEWAQRYEAAERGTSDGLFDWDLRSDRVRYSCQWLELFGGEAGHADSPERWYAQVHSADLPQLQVDVAMHLAGQTPRLSNTHRLVRDGREQWVLCRARACRDEQGDAVRLVGSLSDITEFKRVEQRLRESAERDGLTGLLNRATMVDKVRAAMRRHRLTGGRQHYAVMFLDFDRFKLINDTLGHEAGDGLLKSIARRLGQVLRGSDTAARFGGDEFVVLLEELHHPDEAATIADRLVEAMREPHGVGGTTVTSTASIGVVTSDLEYAKAEDVLRDADLAMYKAKLRGKACWVRFDAAMHAAAEDRLRMETELREAIERRTLALAFQPIVRLGDRRVVGFETLCRWTHATRGVVRPDQFIELAEDTGLIVPLGVWVLHEAARHAKTLAALAGPDFKLTVNVSKRQLQRADAARTLCDAVGSAELARLVTLEVTESVIMDDRMHLGGTLQQLRDYGFGIAMDDFGTGQSSLANLHRLPLDLLKIDRAFVREMYATEHFEGIMQSILLLARHLQRGVVVEGIETEEQAQALHRLGVELGQGFHFAKPMGFEQALALLMRESRSAARAG